MTGNFSPSNHDFDSFESVAKEKSFYTFSYICIFALAAFAIFNFAAGFYHAVAFDLLGIMLYFAGFWVYSNTQNLNLAGIGLIFTCCLELFLQSVILEPDAFHNLFFFPPIGIFCFALFDDRRIISFGFLITCVGAIASYLVPKYLETTVWFLSEEEKDLYMVATFFVTLICSYKIGQTVYNQKEKAFVELKMAKDKLQQMNVKTKSLLQLIIHDVSNPLVSIDFAVKFAGKDCTSDESLERIHSVCDPAILTIREIIETAREMMALEDGKISTKNVPIDLGQSMAETAALFELAAKKKNVRIVIENELPKNVNVLVDPKSFKSSVLSNLISNAIKFSHHNSEVKLQAQEEDNQIILKVIDTGVGMSLEYQDKIFDPTKKTTRPGTDGERGTGYGIPLAKAFVESYGGGIDIVSEENIGTIIKLTLPRVEALCIK